MNSILWVVLFVLRVSSGTVISNSHYLEENAAKDGWKTMKSGLQYKIVRPRVGEAKRASPTTPVLVSYKGRLPHNGQEIAAGTPLHKKERITTPKYEEGGKHVIVPNRVMKGLTEAMTKMKEGEKWEIVLPPNLGWGNLGEGWTVPPNAITLWTVEVHQVQDGQIYDLIMYLVLFAPVLWYFWR